MDYFIGSQGDFRCQCAPEKQPSSRHSGSALSCQNEVSFGIILFSHLNSYISFGEKLKKILKVSEKLEEKSCWLVIAGKSALI